MPRNLGIVACGIAAVVVLGVTSVIVASEPGDGPTPLGGPVVVASPRPSATPEPAPEPPPTAAAPDPAPPVAVDGADAGTEDAVTAGSGRVPATERPGRAAPAVVVVPSRPGTGRGTAAPAPTPPATETPALPDRDRPSRWSWRFPRVEQPAPAPTPAPTPPPAPVPTPSPTGDGRGPCRDDVRPVTSWAEAARRAAAASHEPSRHRDADRRHRYGGWSGGGSGWSP